MAETICKVIEGIPFLESDATELPLYLSAAEDVNVLNEEQKVEWWHRREEQLPRWATAVKQVLLIQPSSVAAERKFHIRKPHSMRSKIVLSWITFKASLKANAISDKRSQLLTVYYNVNVLYELEVEQNCASLGCVYPAYRSA